MAMARRPSLLQKIGIGVVATALLSFVSNIHLLEQLGEADRRKIQLKVPGVSVATTMTTTMTTTTTTFNPKTSLDVSDNVRWWKNDTRDMVRVFQRQKNFSWCIPEKFPTHEWKLTDQGGKARGLIYLKNYKASSSTLEGVSLHIAHRVAEREFDSRRPCIHYNRHVFGDIGALQFREMSRSRSFVWTMIRNPSNRDLSAFYFFGVSRQGVPDTPENTIKFLKEYKSFQTKFLLPWAANEEKQRPDDMATMVRQMKEQIISEYNFLGIVERMEESLAVLVLLLNLDPSDVIVLSAKQAGGYDDGEGTYGKCVKIIKQPPPSQLPPKVQEYLYRDHARDNADYMLYEAANLSLDATIEALGRSEVDRVKAEIQKLQALAEKHCRDQVAFPCSSTGEFQPALAKKSCYVQDAGCGHHCVTSVLQRHAAGTLW